MRVRKAFAQQVVLTLVLATALGGCKTVEAYLFPRKAGLESVHAAYREEFATSLLPSESAGTASSCERPGEAAGFPETREKMRQYREKYGADPSAAQALAHLTVLQGMIALQSGQVGAARNQASAVEAAGAKLDAGTAAAIRDALFAESFDALVDGWEVVCLAAQDGDTEAAARYADPAARIGSSLAARRTAGALTASDADQAARYLAGTAAIFYEWADLSNENACNLREPECEKPTREGAIYLALGEKELEAAGIDASSAGRFGDIYRRLAQKITLRRSGAPR